jgi:hypothetical protein
MIKNILQLLFLVVMVQLIACKDDEPSTSDAKVEMLTAQTWGQPTVIHGTDGDLSDQYPDFAITFTNNPSAPFNGSYIVANGGHAFADATGKWKFNDDQTLIILGSGKEIAFELEATRLMLDFTVAESEGSGGRSNGLSGHFTFELKPI